MPPAFAEVEALAERLGIELDPESADGLRAAAALADASALIRSEAGEDWLDEYGELLDVPAIIESITLQVALRAYRNPDAYSQSTVGDVSVSYSRPGGMAGIYLTREERKAVRRAAGHANTSVPLDSTFLTARDPLWAPTEGGGDLLPIGPVPWED